MLLPPPPRDPQSASGESLRGLEKNARGLALNEINQKPPQPPAWGRGSPAPHKGSGEVQATQPMPSPPVGSQGFEVGVLVGGDVARGRVVCVYVCEHVRMSLKGRQPTRPYLVQ